MNQIGLYLLVLLTLAIAVYGIVLMVKFFRLRIKCKASAEAEIVRLKYHRVRTSNHKKDIEEFTPVVKFYAKNGREYTVEAKEKASRLSSKVGKRVQIFYDESDPETFYIRGRILKLLQGILFFVIGAGFAVMMIVNLFFK